MDQSEIDALLSGKPAKAPTPKQSKAPENSKKQEATPAPVPAPVPTAATAKPASSTKVKPEEDVRVIGELDSVTAVTERETNKVMDKLDQISQLLDQQKDIVTEIMGNELTQNPVIQASIHKIMSAGSDIQNKVWEAMDLMQFQDISRQKLERIIYHLRQIHDYIVELLGTGLQSENQPKKLSLSHSIAHTGTTPDENKSHADSVVDEFLRTKK